MKGIGYFQRKLWEMKGVPQIIKDTSSVLTALVSGETVSSERIAKRVEICGKCKYVKIKPPDNTLACGICGCGVSDMPTLLNLALYEETETYGCKFPGGSQWRKEGV